MPSFNIHLAVAKRYLEKNPGEIKSEKNFYKGNIAPDLATNTSVSHYSGEYNTKQVEKRFKEKVKLEKFLRQNAINTDYQKGIFLHLIVDYLFFNYFIEYKKLGNIEFNEFVKDLRYSYLITNDYINKKYNLDYTDIQEEITEKLKQDKKSFNVANEVRTDLLPLDKLDFFIETTSDITLTEYKKRFIKPKLKIKERKNKYCLNKKSVLY